MKIIFLVLINICILNVCLSSNLPNGVSRYFLKEIELNDTTFRKLLTDLIDINYDCFDRGNVLTSSINGYCDMISLSLGLLNSSLNNFKGIQEFLDSTYHGCVLIDIRDKTYLLALNIYSLTNTFKYTGNEIDVGAWIKQNEDDGYMSQLIFHNLHPSIIFHVDCNVEVGGELIIE